MLLVVFLLIKIQIFTRNINGYGNDCYERTLNKIQNYKAEKEKENCTTELNDTVAQQIITSICSNQSNTSINNFNGLLNNLLHQHTMCDFNKNITMLSMGNVTIDKKISDDVLPDLICNKSWFIKNVIMKAGYLNLTRPERRKIRTKCGIPTNCYSADLSLTYGGPQNETNFYIIVTTDEFMSEENRDCWGYVFIESQYNGNIIINTTVRYFNFFNEKDTDFTQFLPLDVYNFKVISIPSMLQKEINAIRTSKCERNVYELVQQRLTPGICDGKIGYPDLIEHFARPLCKSQPVEAERTKEIEHYFQITHPPCPFVYRITDQSKIRKATKLTIVAIILISISSVVFFVLIVLFGRKCHAWLTRRRLHLERSKFENDDWVALRERRQNSSLVPMVMILCRPGCELLEHLLRDLAYILSSYSIQVKLALLDQHEIDMEGGISSYMQRNLHQCDYILIVFTKEHNEERVPAKHKPYEFALRVISGLAYHNNSSSQYIPVYLTNYNEAVNLLPSFLNATTSFGYQIPHEVNKLVCRILEVKCLKQSKERKIKDDFFVKRMKEYSDMILKNKHHGCCNLNCTKEKGTLQDVDVKNQGQLHDSVSNLSSYWSSTVKSKTITSPLHHKISVLSSPICKMNNYSPIRSMLSLSEDCDLPKSLKENNSVENGT